jgi:hypothetical protein
MRAPCSLRASSRDVSKMEQLKWADIGQARHRLVRRLRAGLVTPLPGGLGSPSVPTKRDCLKWLDAARTKGGESRPDRVGRKPPGSAPGSYGPGDRNRRDGAPIGAHPQPEGARAARRGLIRMRRSALRPLDFSRGKERDYGVPGAAKNTGDNAWLFENLEPRDPMSLHASISVAC